MRLKPFLPRILPAFALASLGWGGPAVSGEVTVFAAASLQEALSETAAAFEAASGHQVVLSFAGSSVLARQVEYGAPADVYMSANVDWTDYLIELGKLDASSQKVLYGNRLSAVVPSNSQTKFASDTAANLLKIVNNGKLAMALYEAVPAGIYGRLAMQSLGVWQEVAPHVVQVDNVRAALALVALGEVAGGIVYATDADADGRVRVVATFPSDSHGSIVYPAAVVAGRERPEVTAFMDFLESDTARAAFIQRGFIALEQKQ